MVVPAVAHLSAGRGERARVSERRQDGRIAVIGCGNANRKDDAVGLEVIRLLRAQEELAAAEDIQLLDAGTDGMAVMFAARGCRALILVDACRSGSEPGTIFEVPGQELETASPHSLNLHDFRWDHALYAGRRIYGDDFPSSVIAYLVEAADVGLGLGLSPAVAEGARCAAGKIALCIARMRSVLPAPALSHKEGS